MSEEGKAVVKRLQQDERADVDVGRGTEGEAALYAAAATGCDAVVRILLDKGTDINSRGGGDFYPTALHGAAQAGWETVVKLLLERKADAAVLNSILRTPLHIAARWGQKNVVMQLLHYSRKEVTKKDKDNWTPRDLAARWRHPAVVQVFIDEEKQL
jgi:ankyrin repeat protein